MGILNADAVRTPTREEAEACVFKLVKTAWQSLHSNHPNSPGKTKKEHNLPLSCHYLVSLVWSSGLQSIMHASQGV